MTDNISNTPLNSSRHEPSYWVAHFEKCKKFDNYAVFRQQMSAFYTGFHTPYKKGNHYDVGVKDEITKKLCTLYSIYNWLMLHARIIAKNPDEYKEDCNFAREFLKNNALSKYEDDMWGKAFLETLHDFLEMYDHLHLCV